MEMRIFPALLLMCFAGSAFADEVTLGRYLLEVNVDAGSNTYYFKATSSPTSSAVATWGSSSCPNAQFVYARDLGASQKDVLAVAMAATAMGRSVTFRGTCDPDGNYFRATRIIMGQ
jgi:hypothetical protein